MHHVNNLAQLLKAHDPVLYQHLLETNTKIETLSYAYVVDSLNDITIKGN